MEILPRKAETRKYTSSEKIKWKIQRNFTWPKLRPEILHKMVGNAPEDCKMLSLYNLVWKNYNDYIDIRQEMEIC